MPGLLFQAGPMAWKATEILREQPQLWQCLAGCLPDAAQRSLALSAPAAAVHEESEDAGEGEVQEWLRKGDTAWRLAAEASALQLFALEAFASPAGSGNTSSCLHAMSYAGRPQDFHYGSRIPAQAPACGDGQLMARIR